jgi:hypothetical protein
MSNHPSIEHTSGRIESHFWARWIIDAIPNDNGLRPACSERTMKSEDAQSASEAIHNVERTQTRFMLTVDYAIGRARRSDPTFWDDRPRSGSDNWDLLNNSYVCCFRGNSLSRGHQKSSGFPIQCLSPHNALRS